MEFRNLNFSLDSSNENLQLYNFIELPLGLLPKFRTLSGPPASAIFQWVKMDLLHTFLRCIVIDF